MRISFRPAVPATLALSLGVMWCVLTIAAVVNGDIVTHAEVEQRARYLVLSVDVSGEAKSHFKQMARSDDLRNTLRALRHEVTTGNPGKTREELIAIFGERQKEIGKWLQKTAVEAARTALLPKLRKDAREELIDERLKLQAARKHGIEVSDADAEALVETLAARKGMTFEQFAQHLNDMDIDIATVVEKLRAQEAEAKALVEVLAKSKGMTSEQAAEQLKDNDVDLATVIERLEAKKAWSDAVKPHR